MSILASTQNVSGVTKIDGPTQFKSELKDRSPAKGLTIQDTPTIGYKDVFIKCCTMFFDFIEISNTNGLYTSNYYKNPKKFVQTQCR